MNKRNNPISDIKTLKNEKELRPNQRIFTKNEKVFQ